MAWTTEQITAVEQAISRGVLTVTLAGESITFQSLDDLLKLRAEMIRELTATASATGGRSYRLGAVSKGT